MIRASACRNEDSLTVAETARLAFAGACYRGRLRRDESPTFCFAVSERARTQHKQGRILKLKPLSQHTGTTRARTGADWHTHRLTTGAA